MASMVWGRSWGVKFPIQTVSGVCQLRIRSSADRESTLFRRLWRLRGLRASLSMNSECCVDMAKGRVLRLARIFRRSQASAFSGERGLYESGAGKTYEAGSLRIGVSTQAASSPPARRKTSVRDVLAFLHARGQIGFPPSMNADAKLGFPRTVYQSAMVARNSREARELALIRLARATSRSHPAPEADSAQREQVGYCPCCTRATHVAVPPTYSFGRGPLAEMARVGIAESSRTMVSKTFSCLPFRAGLSATLEDMGLGGSGLGYTSPVALCAHDSHRRPPACAWRRADSDSRTGATGICHGIVAWT